MVIAGRDKAKNAKATDELREEGTHAIDAVADVTQEEACTVLVAAAVKAFGRLDIFVNDAVIDIIKKLLRFTLGLPLSSLRVQATQETPRRTG